MGDVEKTPPSHGPLVTLKRTPFPPQAVHRLNVSGFLGTGRKTQPEPPHRLQSAFHTMFIKFSFRA